MPVAVPSPPAADPLGTTLADDVKHATLGSLGIPTRAEIVAALRPREEPAPMVVADDQLFARCRLPALPLQKVPIAMGSYLIVIRARGYVDLRLPIVVSRNEDVEVGPAMLREEEVPAGFVYVPGGSSLLFGGVQTNFTLREKRANVGSFLIGEREVTVGEYEEFIKDLARSNPEDVDRRLPENDAHGPYLKIQEDGSFISTGVNWRSEQPIRRISIQNAAAYCEWLSKKTGARIHLPTEEEWERASRGADGRIYPWGHAFLPEFCHMFNTTSTQPDEAAFGRCLADVSPFGVRDMAGGVSEFCGPVELNASGSLAKDAQFFARGGSYVQSSPVTCSATIRLVRIHTDVRASIGFRVVRDL